MLMKKSVKQVSAKRGSQPLRFAHPFFTPQPVAVRKPVPGVGTRLLDHIKGNLEPIPAPARPPVMTLADIIGTQRSQDVQRCWSLAMNDSYLECICRWQSQQRVMRFSSRSGPNLLFGITW